MSKTAQSAQLLGAINQLLADPDFDQVMTDLGMRIFSPYGNRLKLLQSFDRFMAKSTRFTPISIAVKQVPVKIAERDPMRIALWLFNNGPNTVYIGTQAVTVGTVVGDPGAGWPIPNLGSAAIGSVAGEMWATSSTGTNDLRVVDLSG
jgi:hypothetical protein